MKSSTPASAAIAAAVSGLSPVIITVLMPIARRCAKRSRMPPLTMSFRWTTPSARPFSATTSGVPPSREIRSTVRMQLGRQRVARAPAPGARSRRPRPCGSRGRRGRCRTSASARRTARTSPRASASSRAANAELLLRQHDDRPALRRLVGQRRQLRRVGQRLLGDARRRTELGGLTVAERDRAGLVEQQRVDVAGGLDRAAGHRQHVVLHQPIHAGDADRRDQRADRRRDQADQQRDQHRNRNARPGVAARTAGASRRPAGRPASARPAGCSARSRSASSAARRLRRARSCDRGTSRRDST